MALTFDDPSGSRLPVRAERAAKARLPKPESVAKADRRQAERKWVGQAINRTRELAGLSLKEFAARVNRDERQVARWIDGSERAQLELIMAVEHLRSLLIIAFAEAAGGSVACETHIIVRRA